MKIGIDVHSVGSGNGGNETYYRSLISALPRIDSENQYFLYYTYPDAFAADELHANFQPRRVQPNAPYVRIPFALPRQIKQEPIDVFHAQFILPPFVGSRMVTTIPDIGYEHYPEFFPLYQRAWSRLLIRASARRADHIITVSEYSKSDIAKTYGIDREKITVTPESPSENFYPRQRAKAGEVVAKYGVKSSFILYLGRLQGRKNLTRLVNAYSRIRREGCEQKLVLAGKPDSFFQATRSRIHELRLDDDILLPGYVSPEDVPWLYSAADIFVYPSLYEGFGLPVLEAMACGVPVITSQGSALQEVVGDAGLLVDPLDELSIASAIRRLLSDSSLRGQLSDAGLKRSSDFSCIEMARRTLEVYQRVLGHETTRASVGTSAKAV
jgi:glycosyltransferase involved in cell wall biosynthesis